MKTLLLAFIGLGLASCVTPKATVVAEAPKVKSTATKPSAPAPSINTDLDDGLRLGDDILALPSPEQLRSSPNTQGDGNATPIITRPPSE